MARILVGDVGCGKTVCALIAMYIAASSGYQSALMVPTEILAEQHYKEAKKLLGALGMNVELLIGATTQKEKKRIYASLEGGETQIVIGTHTIISDKVAFKNLGLVITDEQHRFGVMQRAKLKEKTEAAHLLVMSATPIPRSLALAMYGDLDITRITDMPKGRQKIDTFVVNESYRKRLNDFIEKQVALGGQCYIVCPSIEKSEDSVDALIPESTGHFVSESSIKLKNVIEYTEELRAALPDIRIELLHGKMKSSEKDEVMASFSSGEAKVLVSTTVIEVGVNVPDATLMIVGSAERFGLSQLHQLRGRVGRGNKKSYCILVSDMNSEKSMARLNVMKSTNDGFEIAERDLAQRGPGDFFATNSDNNFRQSGGFDFKFASMCDDTDLFSSAFATAKQIINADPNLDLPIHKGLKEAVIDKLNASSSTIS
jgi:ATP-dependent DNA helicase RecG